MAEQITSTEIRKAYLRPLTEVYETLVESGLLAGSTIEGGAGENGNQDDYFGSRKQLVIEPEEEEIEEEISLGIPKQFRKVLDNTF
ncbi:MAG: hypothetical protein IJM78_03720 [Prevotella sp.]|nr:hypothetical protein [Prevotella sp.]